MAAAITVTADQEPHDRLKALKAFDELKTGVKGLVDSGITSIPQIFIHPSDTLSTSSFQYDPDIIPTIDLSAVDGDRRPAIVDQIARASRKRGFFHVLNHGIQSEVMDQTIKAVKGFHELPTEIKSKMYNRDKGHSVSFFSNVDLFHNIEAVCWRDSLQIMVGSNRLEDEEIPEICRNEVVEWHSHLKPLAELLIGLICEGLGLDKERLKEMKFSEAGAIVGHYYPYCPQPDLTLGLKSHTDASMLTILLQDHIGGLQIKHNGNWVDVKPVPGALAVFVGDILQMIFNDEYKSGEHRVVANSGREPRTSVPVFFYASNMDASYGPLPELLSLDKPALYRQFSLLDFIRRFFVDDWDGKSILDFYRI
ncbi:1-aminocyclopropane-1-carboxylate oxidase homolog 4-like [Tripterygium wilfordii]|uniref:1-aminocyclopropane-1-carboxylate oxidase homolog 4-like n=1 Tax=Tripterygium wilfordii TaxID=458696 RepID=UPI0018F8052D|nr:1-aminocyclopropane-1-carboxylate oxidase homolog 4-like [Tripterygium wilfordii]